MVSVPHSLSSKYNVSEINLGPRTCTEVATLYDEVFDHTVDGGAFIVQGLPCGLAQALLTCGCKQRKRATTNLSSLSWGPLQISISS